MDCTPEEVAELEERGWRALADSAAAATAFYREVLDTDPVMLLPGGLRLADREQIIASMGGQPWSRYRLEEVAVLRPAPDTAVVAYGVVAHRAGAPEYSALVSSHYVRRGGAWRLVFHQQTPR
ncbi:DUF4440 domain-containing protein [Streptomonospora nanhaiensis]|uniref:DUF4440 domain-containing protein n=1 Tax=Streptomonospora nanhaiensis TaxID=1323731 RepID=A0A853BI01_9ACTN|nr:nuclear transport factor 2 family protein [Streptomonospora nanhaiensis]MBV2363152.1 nuclear transport factor 2 family protein [Streptomonospora nanhaiensis]MBX9389250.1 nuclear transport factor 2 family protein [Streptomonospora nanhaiensis]NYI94354.1 hypothetical protein [Streptomonospora nanhaiensis]